MSRSASRRVARSAITFVLSLTLVLVTLPAIAAGAPGEAQGPTGARPVEFAPPGPVPPPIPAGDRIPVGVPADPQGRHLPPVAIPTTGATRGQVPPGAVLDRGLGAENVDVYRYRGAEHMALVHTRDVNYQDVNGDWVDLMLAPTPGGWEGVTGAAGSVTVRFPDRLGPNSSITYTSPAGTIAVVPESVTSVPGTQNDLSVTYANAMAATDLTYTLDAHGYKENVILRTPAADPAIAWSVRTDGLTLQPGLDGSITIVDSQGIAMGTISAPLLIDATGASAASTYSLTESADGEYRLALVPDASFLATATFPVVVDPGIHDNNDNPEEATRDTYVNSSAAGTSYENAGELWVGTSPNRHTFVKFDISNRTRDERIIYGAVMSLAKVSGSGGDIEARRVTGNWPATSPGMTFNNMPPVGATIDPSHTTDQSWSSWELKEQYQHMMPAVPGLTFWANQGTRLSKPLGTSAYKFYSSEAFSGTAGDPVLFLSWNDQPAAPTLRAPDPDATIESESPTLKIDQLPNDFNGDKVYTRFQISDNGTDWTGSHLVHQSGWLKQETSYSVPAGALTDGQTYWWRAQSWDAYSLTDGAGIERVEKASGTRKFTVSLNHLGVDERWAIWSRPLGNGMTLNVNEANGNLILDVPLDTVATALGDVDLSVTYNSQQTVGYGLTPGWDVAIGPASSGRDLPIELVKMTPQPDAGVKIRLSDGRTLYFPHRSGRVYASVGSGAGEVRGAADEGFTYRTPDGGRFTFTAAGNLKAAKPAWSTPGSGNASLDYNYTTLGSSEKLTSVVDPLGRQIAIDRTDVSPYRVEAISTWDGRTWTFDTSSGRLTSITTPIGDRMSFTSDTSGRLTEVRDGEQTVDGSAGWRIAYSTDVIGTSRVDTITPAGAPTAWDFEYPSTANEFRGTTAAWTKITDPRGTATSLPVDDYQTFVEFNWAGLPLRITEAADQTGYRPVTITVWDANNNMLCQRGPSANAVALGAADETCANEALTTQFEYEDEEPFRMTKVTHPAPNPDGSGSRQVETFAYDEGFQGLWAEMYRNQTLAGVPVGEQLWAKPINEDWQSGSPDPVGADDSWSIRFTGYLDLTDKVNDKDYEFNAWSNDGVTITIGNKTIVDCFGQTQNASVTNCGLGQPVEKTLSPGLKPITIEYSELTGVANLQLKWDQGLDSGGAEWEFIPKTRFRPNLGLLTRHTITLDATATRETIWDYSTDDAKARQLPISQTVQAAGGTDLRTLTYVYNSYGQVTGVSNAVGSTTNTFTNDATTSCLTSSTLKEPNGAVVSTTTYACDATGRVTTETLDVPPVPGTNQTGDTDRTTQTTYDQVGRVLTVDYAGNGMATPDLRYAYDDGGRVRSESQLVNGATMAVTEYEYDVMGRLIKTTLPDPDGAAQLPRPLINTTWDWVGNKLSESDPRNGAWVTSYTYDALNRLVQTKGPDPEGLISTTEYRLSSSGSYDHRVSVTSPAGVTTVTALNMLGRTTSERIGSLSPATFVYDQDGNVVSLTTPDPDGAGPLTGVRTDTTYTVHGDPKTVTEYAQAGTQVQAKTTNTYDAAGRLTQVDGPRSGDEIVYTLDAAGRITKVTQPGITVPGTTQPVTTEVKYTSAGERVWMKTRLDADTDFVRNWTYDAMGRLETFANARGTTSYDYNDAGWLTGMDDPRAGMADLAFAYDNVGRLIERRSGAAADRETFAYDPAGNQTSATAYGPDGTTVTSSVEMRYDHVGRLDRVTAGQDVTTYTFSPTTGLLASVADAAGTTSFTYDANGLLDTLDDPLTSGVADYGYDQAGRVVSRTDTGSGLVWTRTYEAATGLADTQTVTSVATTLLSADLAYDPAGNVVSRTQTVNGTSDSWIYAYDSAGRLESATPTGGPTTTYGYDGGSNRTSVKVGANPATTTDYDSASLPVSSSDGTAFTHDAVGNLTGVDAPDTPGDWTYTYDAWSRLRGAQQGTSPPIAYTLDALSRVLTRTEGAETTSYLYRGTSEDPTKVTLGPVVTTYAYSPGGPLAQAQGGQLRTLLRDLHGDVVGLATTAGTVAGTRTFDPWGAVRASTGETTSFGFQGDPTDPDTGLVDMVTRHYVPSLGRFTTRDGLFGELAAPGSLNQYTYGGADPVSNTDLLGSCANPDYCPQQIGFGTKAKHNAWFAGSIDTAGARWSAAVRPPAPAPVPAPIVPRLHQLGLQIIESGLTGWATVVDTSSRYGYLLRYGSAAERSLAARMLPEFGGSVFDDLGRLVGTKLLRGVSKGLAWIGVGLEFASHAGEGDSLLEAGVKTGTSAAISSSFIAGGAAIGCAIAPGFGCVVGGVVGGIASFFIADQVNKAIEGSW